MKIEHLRLFVFIASSSSINSAAKELFISQQQLNRIVTGLEDELHTKLFVRNSKGISLTQNGMDLLDFADKILYNYDEMQNYFSSHELFSSLSNQTIQGHCVLYVPCFFSVFLNDFIFKFKEIAPGIHLTCIEDHEDFNKPSFQNGLHLLNYVSSETALKQLQSSFIVENIGSYKLFLITNKTSPFSKMLSFDTSKMDLPDFLTLLPSMDYESFPYCKNKLLFVSANIFQHIEAVIKYNSVFYAPDFVLPKLRIYSSDIKFIPLNQDVLYHQYIVYPKSHVLTEAETLLISYVELYIQNLSLNAKHMIAPSIDEF